MTQTVSHQTVLKEEAVAALAIRPCGNYIDATFGRGGHSQGIIQHLSGEGRLLVIDRDPEAISVARQMSENLPQMSVAHGAFGEIEEIARCQGIYGNIAGILFDLGVSSPQLDSAGRGFSFTHDGPLDMRMDPGRGVSARDWINSAPEKEIADVLYRFGEERHSRRMARRIVQERQQTAIESTGRLAEIIKVANPSWERDKHPATRAFQGIRIFINNELDELRRGLEQALKVLDLGGRLVVISFHSLEDRIVKKFIAMQTKGDNFPRDLPVSSDMLNPTMKIIGKAVKPGADEINNNPRARSAVMRVAEKIGHLA